MLLHATQSFPFGNILLSSVSSPALDNVLVIQRVAYKPVLPSGMAVDLVAAYRIALKLSEPVHSFSFDITIPACQAPGDTNSGEGLDAQSWDLDEARLMLGTEDGDALRRRMPWLPSDEQSYPIDYLSNGFRISIPYIAPNNNVGFHFVLAYNQVDRGDDSEWFAVDVPHEKLCEFPIEKQLCGPS